MKKSVTIWLITLMLINMITHIYSSDLSNNISDSTWRNNNLQEVQMQTVDDGFNLKVIGTSQYDCSIIKQIPITVANQDFIFSAKISESAAKMAYLQVKLLRGKKEIKRIESKRLSGSEAAMLSVAFNTEDIADTIQLLCRVSLTEQYVGQTAQFTDMKLSEASPTNLPRLQIVPGYQACSLYLNYCKAESLDNFQALVYFSSDNQTFQPALDLVYQPNEKSARGSIVNLSEDTNYTLRIEISDSGQNEIIDATFRTRNSIVPISKTIVLDANTAPAAFVVKENGSPDGYICYTAASDFVLNGDTTANDALCLDNAAYVIIEGLTIRGGQQNGITVRNASHIIIRNCDIADFGRVGQQRRDLDGKFYQNGRPLNNDAAILVLDSDDIVIERNYLHDPRSTANSWFYSHPAGPNAAYIGNVRGLVFRYNDCIGSDARRWNDAVEGWYNESKDGGPCRDAEIVGNYFAFANDDGMELDGGQINCRFWRNKSESTLCGVSTAPCLLGPSYLWENLLVDPGDEMGYSGAGFKNNYHSIGFGRIHFINNTVTGDFNTACSNLGGIEEEYTIRASIFKSFARNNIFQVAGVPVPRGLFRVRSDFDYDLTFSYFQNTVPTEALQTEFAQEIHAVTSAAIFTDAENGLYNLADNSPGRHAGVLVANFSRQEKPHLGAITSDEQFNLPYRPVDFYLDSSKLVFAAASLDNITSRTVTLTATQADFRQNFRICQNQATRYFQIKPEAGVLEYGRPVQLTISIDPGQLISARLYSGAFLVRLDNGFSRPVSVYADARQQRGLLARDRKDAHYGLIQPITGSTDGEITSKFTLDQAGDYYLFVQSRQRLPGGIDVAINDQPARRFWLHVPPVNQQTSWANLGSLTYVGEANRPLRLSAGEHVFTLTRNSKGQALDIIAVALSSEPEVFTLSPRMDNQVDVSKPTIHLVGDSTMAFYDQHQAPMMGWGQMLAQFTRPGVQVVNHARGGRSAKSFRDEGHWQRMLTMLHPGDFVIIQFGHNDQKKEQPAVYLDPTGGYPAALREMITEVRDREAYPVLATSIYRRIFSKDGVLQATLGDYPAAMRHIAVDTDTPLVDLQEATGKLFSQAGETGSSRYFTHTAAGEYSRYPQGITDNSHLNAVGAEVIARLAAEEITRIYPALANWLTFSVE